MSTQQDWIERVGAIRKWTRGGERAPHKPLLLLFALGRLQRIGRNEPIRYVDAELPLASLLADFGPPRQTSPAYPFRRLANDGLWVLSTPSGQSVEDQPAALRRADARGVLETQFAEALLGDSALLSRVGRVFFSTQSFRIPCTLPSVRRSDWNWTGQSWEWRCRPRVAVAETPPLGPMCSWRTSTDVRCAATRVASEPRRWGSKQHTSGGGRLTVRTMSQTASRCARCITCSSIAV